MATLAEAGFFCTPSHMAAVVFLPEAEVNALACRLSSACATAFDLFVVKMTPMFGCFSQALMMGISIQGWGSIDACTNSVG